MDAVYAGRLGTPSVHPAQIVRSRTSPVHNSSSTTSASQRLRLPDLQRLVLRPETGLRGSSSVYGTQFFSADGNFVKLITSDISRKHAGQTVKKGIVSAVFERFTERAIKSVMLAQKEAKAMGRGEVGLEQLLLGLVAEERGSDGFLKTGITIERAREALRSIIDVGEPSPVTDKPASEVTFSLGSKRAFEIALDQSRTLGHNFIAPEHIAVAVIAVGEPGVELLLEKLELRKETLVAEAVSRLRGELAKDGRSTAGMTGKQTISASAGRRTGSRKEKGALNEFCIDITARAADGKIDPVIGRDKEVQRVVQILARRTKNNPILLGEPGVGKTAIAEGLATQIVSGSVPEFLSGKRVMSLDMGLLLAGAKERGELETRVTSLIRETITSGNVILLIDEVHTLVGSGSVGRGGQGLDIANLLKPALARGQLQCIGATTLDEHRKHIEKDKALNRRFQPVMVAEPSQEDATAILLGLKERYEQHHQCVITPEAVIAAVELSARYIPDRFLPDKAIDLMDEAGSRARINSFRLRRERESSVLSLSPSDIWREIRAVQAAQEAYLVPSVTSLLDRSPSGTGLSSTGSAIGSSSLSPAATGAGASTLAVDVESELASVSSFLAEPPGINPSSERPVVVGPAEIAAVASMWSGVPLEQLTAGEQERLVDLEALLHSRVVGQDDAVGAISRAVRRARVGLKDPKRPIAAMLFCGPTGVGKSELAKALAQHYFGSESAMVRLDMSEYMERHSVSKLVGSPPGYVGFGDTGTLTEAVRRRPFTVVLLDEIEKAHPDVFNLLLQVFEDGRLTDSQGRVVSFKNTLLIMTSNVGSSAIARGGGNRIGFTFPVEGETDGGRYSALKEMVTDELKAYFRPELLNRLDEVVVFRTLEEHQLRAIVDIMLKEAVNRVAQRGVLLEVTEALISQICTEGYDRAYGARPLRRAITRLVENPLSEALLGGIFQEGDSALVDWTGEGEAVVIHYPKPDNSEQDVSLSALVPVAVSAVSD